MRRLKDTVYGQEPLRDLTLCHLPCAGPIHLQCYMEFGILKQFAWYKWYYGNVLGPKQIFTLARKIPVISIEGGCEDQINTLSVRMLCSFWEVMHILLRDLKSCGIRSPGVPREVAFLPIQPFLSNSPVTVTYLRDGLYLFGISSDTQPGMWVIGTKDLC